MPRLPRSISLATMGYEPDDAPRAHVYEIRVRGWLSPRLRSAFEPLETVTETVLRGKLEDQAALHTVLSRIHDLGIELVDVRRVDDTQSQRS